MSGESPEDQDAPVETPAERRRRLARVFGEVLPEQTRDDQDPRTGEGDGGPGERDDAWWRRQVPPHHGS